MGDVEVVMSVTARASHPLLRRLPSFLPTGRSLRPEEFALRHRGILVLLWLHVPSLAVFGVLRGYGVVHSLGEAAVIAASPPPRSTRAGSA
jgi:hypothetical protein